ncbi:MAG TPA: threonine/serine dehydratase [Candidatus Eremiobacteraceae bacterium]|nr:threonine/serine dehydratase [Candidatus Eremiobacteraceae bacterium]
MTDRLDIHSLALGAETRIRPHVPETPLRRSDFLSDEHHADVYLKLENLQLTGSFKVRGAFTKLLSLGQRERSRGVVVASTGNHGLAMAYAMKRLGVAGIVFVPEGAAATKVDNIRRYGAEVRFHGPEGGATERHARSYAAEHGMVYVSPYNDVDVVAGQATVGVEIARQLDGVDVVIASLGGGGLIGGIAGFLKAASKRARVVAVSPRNSKAMMESVKAGRVIDTEHRPTLSDATAGGIDHDTITFDLCRLYVDDFVDVDEAAIRAGMRDVIEREHLLVEGSAAVAVAGLAELDGLAGKKIAVVLCGANIDASKLKEAL